ncbi:hypothetical protein EJ02DRAFT_24045 [Clathrospora elynae]|uniref:Uncharacterized protein n=1 Tax=Clathrospora elynae TaxID=706981 RepID=A0A6A5T0H3_9PLEO|nr:hypothetical protein EJ02DRAFT_24045 [Clathrospora elynae]
MPGPHLEWRIDRLLVVQPIRAAWQFIFVNLLIVASTPVYSLQQSTPANLLIVAFHSTLLSTTSTPSRLASVQHIREFIRANTKVSKQSQHSSKMSTFHCWFRLPDELKLEFLSHHLEFRTTINAKMHQAILNEQLGTLIHT